MFSIFLEFQMYDLFRSFEGPRFVDTTLVGAEGATICSHDFGGEGGHDLLRWASG